MRELQRVVVTPGVWLLQRRCRYLAGLYFRAAAPLVIWLNDFAP
jgi:hypothetical protein